MSAQAGTENTSTLKQILIDAAKDIQSARKFLARAGEAVYDEKTVRQLRVERESLEAFLDELNGALTTDDRDLQARAAGALKDKAPSLRSVTDLVKQLDPAAPSEVAGFMEEAVTYINQAMTILKGLP